MGNLSATSYLFHFLNIKKNCLRNINSSLIWHGLSVWKFFVFTLYIKSFIKKCCQFIFLEQRVALFNEHKSFVQGVAMDPQNEYVATMSTDR